MLWKIAVPPSLAFPMTLPPLPLMPSLTGGTRKVPLAIPVPASCSFWLIPAAATVAAVMPGKPNSSPNWPTPYALAVTVAHYPTGASKRNPIEHRLFSEVSRNWADEPLDSHQKILNYARTIQTQTGLQVTAYSRPPTLSLLSQTHTLSIGFTSIAAPRNSPRAELHYQASTVNSFLRDSQGSTGDASGLIHLISRPGTSVTHPSRID
jgi:hypothetical protein